MKDVNVKNTAIVSASMMLSAVSSVSASPAEIQVEKDFDVDEGIMAQIDKIAESKNVKNSLAQVFSVLINKIQDEDKKLIEKYFSEYLNADGTEFAQSSFDYDNLRNCNVGDTISYSACYSNCHGACHRACHGSRGWR
jgi:purine-nucleoside phosphorylase